MTKSFHKNIRMKDWDYSQSAVYMVTICIADRTHRLGFISEADEAQPGSAGKMVSQEVLALAERHDQVELDQFVIMPNHIHPLVGVNLSITETDPITLPSLIGELKSRTTNRYIKGVRMGLLPPFDKKLWQDGYYETVMRDERMTEERRNYIINNPANWRDDPEMSR